MRALPMGVLRIQGEYRTISPLTESNPRHQRSNISIFWYRINGSLLRPWRRHKFSTNLSCITQPLAKRPTKTHGYRGEVYILLVACGFFSTFCAVASLHYLPCVFIHNFEKRYENNRGMLCSYVDYLIFLDITYIILYMCARSSCVMTNPRVCWFRDR